MGRKALLSEDIIAQVGSTSSLVEFSEMTGISIYTIRRWVSHGLRARRKCEQGERITTYERMCMEFSTNRRRVHVRKSRKLKSQILYLLTWQVPIQKACDIMNIHIDTLRSWRMRDAEFDQAVDDALSITRQERVCKVHGRRGCECGNHGRRVDAKSLILDAVQTGFDGKPMYPQDIQPHLEQYMHIATIRRHLGQMADEGMIERIGERGGYIPHVED